MDAVTSPPPSQVDICLSDKTASHRRHQLSYKKTFWILYEYYGLVACDTDVISHKSVLWTFTTVKYLITSIRVLKFLSLKPFRTRLILLKSVVLVISSLAISNQLRLVLLKCIDISSECIFASFPPFSWYLRYWSQFPIMFNIYFVYLSANFLSVRPSGVFFQGLDILHPIFQFTLHDSCHSRCCVTSRTSLSPFLIDFFTNCCSSILPYKPQYKASFFSSRKLPHRILWVAL
jgi:hypothetical protein